MTTAEFLVQAMLFACIVSNVLAVYAWILAGRTVRNTHLPSLVPAVVSLAVFEGSLLVPPALRPQAFLVGYTGLYLVANVLSWQVVRGAWRQQKGNVLRGPGTGLPGLRG